MKKHFLSGLLVCLLTPSFAQETDSTKSSVSGNTFGGNARDLSKLLAPNVASFEKVVHSPVNYNTGQLAYELPFFQIPVDEKLSIPITLSYANSGLKPDEVPSWVGNGWNLNIGGTITQYVKGINDLGTRGLRLAENRDKLESFWNHSMTDLEKLEYRINLMEQVYDSQYDYFSLNIPGIINQFYFDKDSIKLVKKDNIKIEYGNSQFLITDDRGNKFLFGLKAGSSGTYSDPMINRTGFRESTDTWYLTQITTPNNEQINFTYQYDISYWVRETDVTYSNGHRFSEMAGNICQIQSAYVQQTANNRKNFSQYLLKSIDYPFGTIEFQHGDREDLSNITGAKSKSLLAIRVRNTEGEVTKKISFSYGYLGGATANDRLQLNSIALSGKDTTLTQAYSFEYYPSASALPVPGLERQGVVNPQNNNMDYWGYFNGQSNTDRVPRLNYSDINSYQSSGATAGGANRYANDAQSRRGMLKRITYPDKGYEEFEYEGNRSNKPTIVELGKYLQQSEQVAHVSQYISKTVNCKTGTVTQDFYIPTHLDMGRINVSMIGSNITGRVEVIRLSDNEQILNTTQNINEVWEEIFNRGISSGNYRYTLTLTCPTAESFGAGRFEVTRKTTDYTWISVGGNRIKRIKTYPMEGKPFIRSFQYEEASLSNPVQFHYYKQEAIPENNLQRCIPCGSRFVIGGANIFTFEGHHIEYKSVSEFINLETKNNYTYVEWPSVGYAYPAPSNIMRYYFPWRTGLSRTTSLQRTNENIFPTVKRSTSVYTPDSEVKLTELRDLSVSLNYPCREPLSTYPLTDKNLFFDGYDYRYSDRFGKLQEIVNTNSDLGAVLLADTTTYTYNDRWQPYKIKSSRSDSRYSIQTSYYAEDFNNVAGTNIASLKDKHIIGKPVKVIQEIDGQTVGGALVKYDEKGNLAEIYQFESGANHVHNPAIYFNPDFKIEETRTYNSRGRLTSFSGRDGISYVYLWSYNYTHPVALIAHATLAEVSAIIGSPETFAVLTSETAIASGLQQLRSSLPKAQLTTALYVPGIGIKQLTSPEGMLYSYEYDGMNRLSTVKDRDNKAVDVYSYQNALNLIEE